MVLINGWLVVLMSVGGRIESKVASSIVELVASLSRNAWSINSWPWIFNRHWTRISTVCLVLQILGVLIKTVSISSWSWIGNPFPLSGPVWEVVGLRLANLASRRLTLVSRTETLVSSKVFLVLPWIIWVGGMIMSNIFLRHKLQICFWQSWQVPLLSIAG